MGVAIIVPDVDFKTKGMGIVHAWQEIPLTSISVNVDTTINKNGQASVSYTPELTTQKGVVWSIVSGGEYASINQSGEISVNDGVENQTIKIRATSSAKPYIYAEAETVVNNESADLYDYIETDSFQAFVVVPGLQQFGGRLTLKCTRPKSQSCYVFGACKSSSAVNERLAVSSRLYAYGYCFGSLGFNSGGTWAENTKATYEFNLSPDENTNGSLIAYDSEDNVVYEREGKAWLDSDLFFFNIGTNTDGPNSGYTITSGSSTGICRIYSLKLEDAEGNIVKNIRAAKDEGGTACLFDTISGEYFYNLKSGTLIVGND